MSRRKIKDVGVPAADTPSGAPRLVVDAWLPAKVTAAGLRLHPMTALDYLALTKLGSPLLRLLEGRPDVTLDPVDVAGALLILSSPPQVIRELCAAGQSALQDATWLAAARIPLAELPECVRVLKRALEDALATALPAATPGAPPKGKAPPAGSST